MTPAQFYRRYIWFALAANGFSLRRAEFALTQAALESGWASNSLAEKANNLFSVWKGGSWDGPVYVDSRGREWRKYSTPYGSFKDHANLLRTSGYPGYLTAYNATDIEQYAAEISASPYITDQPGAYYTDRALYQANLLKLYRQVREEGRKFWTVVVIVVVSVVILVLAWRYARRVAWNKSIPESLKPFFAR